MDEMLDEASLQNGWTGTIGGKLHDSIFNFSFYVTVSSGIEFNDDESTELSRGQDERSPVLLLLLFLVSIIGIYVSIYNFFFLC